MSPQQSRARLGGAATTELKVGMMVRDNDPRTARPSGVVVKLDSGFAILRLDSSRITTVRVRRIYLDGKPRLSGWSVVP